MHDVPRGSESIAADETDALQRKAGRSRLKFPAIAMVLLVLGALTVAFADEVRDQLVPRRFGVVEQGSVYRSGQISETLIDNVLTDYGIDVVVSLSRDKMHQSFTAAEVAAGQALGIERVNCPLRGDGTGDITQYANAIEAIEKARKSGKSVLVHCYAGTQRTGAAIGFWRILVQGKSGAEAFAEMEKYDHDPADNPHLLPYMNKHMRTLATMLVERGVIDRVPEKLPVVGPDDGSLDLATMGAQSTANARVGELD